MTAVVKDSLHDYNELPVVDEELKQFLNRYQRITGILSRMRKNILTIFIPIRQ